MKNPINPIVNSYMTPYVNRKNMMNSDDMHNTYRLDKQIGDVNGDKIPDTVYLIGEKKQNPFYENIRVVVEDGKTNRRFTIPLYPKYSMAYTPWLFLGSFTDANVNEIMVSLPVGGSGALTYYYVISFLNNIPNVILGPEEFVRLTDNLGFEVEYMDYYKVLVKSKKLDQSYVLDVSNRKATYEGTVYNKDGTLIKPKMGFVIDFPHLNPIKFDGNQPYKLQAQQDIAGTSHVDRLGEIVTYWKYNVPTKSWVVDPEMFFVMLQ